MVGVIDCNPIKYDINGSDLILMNFVKYAVVICLLFAQFI